ncbi:MAG TPA: hypothetical protein VI916_11875 [Acidimicrobiia bacterium]|nr:hypothetical protein [Acidimicrobiia bacterium]
MDRRALFFLIASAICISLIKAAPAEFSWIPTAMAITYAVMAGASYLDSRSED